MPVLFSVQGKEAIENRIAKLQVHSARQWGKMDVAQMLAHCQKPINVALGTHPIDDGILMKILSALFGKKAKNDFVNGKEIKKNAPTAPSFKIVGTKNFEEEKQKLLKGLNALVDKGMKGDLMDRHPFFGKMSISDWDLLHYKHLDHHLKQFGA